MEQLTNVALEAVVEELKVSGNWGKRFKFNLFCDGVFYYERKEGDYLTKLELVIEGMDFFRKEKPKNMLYDLDKVTYLRHIVSAIDAHGNQKVFCDKIWRYCDTKEGYLATKGRINN